MESDRRWSLEELVPHAHPMILIDEVRDEGESGFCAQVRITEDCLYFEPSKGVPAFVGIEYIAQTVAAFAGLKTKRSGGGVGLGYLLGARHYHAHQPYFRLGALLTIRVEAEFETVGFAKYIGKIQNEAGELIVDTAVTVYSPRSQQGVE